MWKEHDVTDADGHVMEPLWLWAEYIEPAFREQRIRVLRDPNDGDKLLINGTPSQLIRRLGGIAAANGQDFTDWNHLRPDGAFASYRDSCTTASWEGPSRLNWLDRTGIERSFLFPSLGLIWPREVDPTSPYAQAHFDAYNRWLLDMTSPATDRLIPVAQIAQTDDLARRLVALADEGFRHVMMPAGLTDMLTEADVFFAAVEDLGLGRVSQRLL